MNVVMLERVASVIGAILVAGTASVALRNDWRTPGLENQVFKGMLALLAFGAVLAFFAAIGVLGRAP